MAKRGRKREGSKGREGESECEKEKKFSVDIYVILLYCQWILPPNISSYATWQHSGELAQAYCLQAYTSGKSRFSILFKYSVWKNIKFIILSKIMVGNLKWIPNTAFTLSSSLGSVLLNVKNAFGNNEKSIFKFFGKKWLKWNSSAFWEKWLILSR